MLERYAAVRWRALRQMHPGSQPALRHTSNTKHLTPNIRHTRGGGRILILHEVKGAVSAAHADT